MCHPQAPTARATATIWSLQERRFQLLLQQLPSISPPLRESVCYQVLGQGKRLRAVLPVLTQRILCPERATEELALWGGLALELVHAGTLSHDDVIDGDTHRRGVLSVWRRFGVPQAILTGDVLFYLAMEALMRAPVPGEHRHQALAHHIGSVRSLADGQLRELELVRQRVLPTTDDIARIAREKTGGLLGHALYIGALSAGVGEASRVRLGELGVAWGEVFQLRDDLLDLLGDKGRLESGCDLLEGKPSWLIADLSQKLSRTQRAHLVERLYRQREATTSEDAAWIRAQLEAKGCLQRGVEALERMEQALFADLGAVSEALSEALHAMYRALCPPLTEAAP